MDMEKSFWLARHTSTGFHQFGISEVGTSLCTSLGQYRVLCSLGFNFPPRSLRSSETIRYEWAPRRNIGRYTRTLEAFVAHFRNSMGFAAGVRLWTCISMMLEPISGPFVPKKVDHSMLWAGCCEASESPVDVDMLGRRSFGIGSASSNNGLIKPCYEIVRERDKDLLLQLQEQQLHPRIPRWEPGAILP
ncbi:hypothetical protein Tco_1405126 [Tanacetum coccineum]